jgi:hypothetical protein
MNRHLPADVADFKAWVEHQVASCTPDEQAQFERYLRAFPGRSWRDYKGKGDPCFPAPTQHGERPWRKLRPDDVRALAVTTLARDLPRNYRQAASHDRALIFNELARKYRYRTDEELEAGGA